MAMSPYLQPLPAAPTRSPYLHRHWLADALACAAASAGRKLGLVGAPGRTETLSFTDPERGLVYDVSVTVTVRPA